MDNTDPTLSELLDLNELKSLFEDLSMATGFTFGLADQISNSILVNVGGRDICVKFHRNCPASARLCQTNTEKLITDLLSPGEIRLESCENGVIHGCTPLIVEGCHLATLHLGPLFWASPDKEFFRQQARQFGYDEEAYLAALDQVPIIEEEKVRAMLKSMAHLVTMLISPQTFTPGSSSLTGLLKS